MRLYTCLLLGALLCVSCAKRAYEIGPLDTAALATRGTTETRGKVRVTAAVPGPAETEELFGLPLYERGVQPVWLEVTNRGASRIRVALVSLDPEYFSPLEVAYMHKRGFSKEARREMEARFYRSGMERRIPAGESRSGFVFTHLDPGTKAFNVDIYSNEEDQVFTFFIAWSGTNPGNAMKKVKT